ncbi:MAG: lipopolysaccharide heptosyltransferase II [Pseudomonadota bacterium]
MSGALHADVSLIVGPAWVGDMVMTHTLVQLLAQRDERLHVLAPPATAPVAERFAEVERVIPVDFAHGELGLGKRRTVGRGLRRCDYGAAYVIPNSWKSALVPFFAGIDRRVGWQGEARWGLLNRQRRLSKPDYPLMIERCMALADDNFALPHKPYPEPRLVADAANAQALCERFDLNPQAVTVLCPGAEFGAAKKWPVAYYAAVAQHVLDAGGQVWVMGSPKDEPDARAVCAAAQGAHNLAGKTRLADAIDLISLARQAVCNDSGLMHVACALGVPTIGVFGSTSPDFTPPLGAHAEVVGLANLQCRPCFQRECPLGHLDCLRKLEPEQVIARLQS